MKEITTQVIFYKEENEILAVFPYLPEQYGQVSCYAHVGQHSTASVEYCDSLRMAKKKEYNDLYHELMSIGYKLKVLNAGSWIAFK
jgi:hypothetical protein